ncbi:MAG: PDZ domain-containing protein [Bdellovibrionales bacterium]|nr:PDZ domain-containing protein [Bdellovibrionales bacterium]
MKRLIAVTLLLSLNAFASTTGFKITSVEPGSTYSTWELKEGDTIQKINNKDVASLNDLMGYLGNPTTVKILTVIRDNQEVIIKRK